MKSSISGIAVLLGVWAFSTCAVGLADEPIKMGSPQWQPTPENPVGWRGDGSGRYPAADPPIAWKRKKAGDTYATKNILWMSRLPNRSVATPIIVATDFSHCRAVRSHLPRQADRQGAVMRSNEEAETIGDDDRAANPAYAQIVDPLARQLPAANDEAVASLDSGDDKRIANALKEKADLDKQLYEALKAIDKKRFDRYWAKACSVSPVARPPATANALAYFHHWRDRLLRPRRQAPLDRPRQRRLQRARQLRQPLLIGNRLVVWAAETRGYDIDSGKIAFQNPAHGENTYGSLFRLHVGSEDVAAFQSGYFTRVSDGKPSSAK